MPTSSGGRRASGCAPNEGGRVTSAPTSVASGMPPAEVSIDVERVHELLRTQHPDLANRPIAVLAEGWDTMTFRLGEDLLVRLPRRAAVGALIGNEHTWLPRLA